MSLCSPVAFNAVTDYIVGITVCCECMLNLLHKMEVLITVLFQTPLLLLQTVFVLWELRIPSNIYFPLFLPLIKE